MDNHKIKHLEFIQNVITRMNSNSFLIKGWSITLVSALFALAAKDANENYVLVAYLVIPVSWVIDGFFISTERKFRDLYNDVAAKQEINIDFSMDITPYKGGQNSWICGILSKTLIPFYLITIATILIIIFLFI